MANLRGNIANTEYFLEEAKLIKDLNKNKVSLEYLKGIDLDKKGLSLAYAVGKGSKNEPIVLSLSYKGNGE
jgi:leucyl aminopeptidase